MEKENNVNVTTPEVTTTVTPAANAAEPKTYTQADIDALIASEADRRVSKAQSRWEKESDRKVTEAQKLAKMSSDEKYEYELKKREETIASRERDLAINANKVECLKIMSDKGIDSSLVEFIVTEDATEMNERIATFERIINNAVAKEVASRINSGTPTTHGTASGVLTKESFKKLSIVEQSRIANESPELYKELTAR